MPTPKRSYAPDKVFSAAAMIIGASAVGGKGEGLHKSPVLVSHAVDLAEQLIDEIEKRAAAADAEPDSPPPADLAKKPADAGASAPTA